MEDIGELIGPIVAAIVLSVLAMGWSALKKYVLKTPNKWDDAIMLPLDKVIGAPLRAHAAKKAAKKSDEDKPSGS
jgi:hypothetical protein